MNPTLRLHDAIAAVAPVASVSIGRQDDKATWRITFADGSQWRYGDNPALDTATQKAARAVVAAFDYAAVLPDRVKAEARRRILARLPEWKQANMTARGVELLNIRMSVGSWTQQQAQEAAALSAAWDWVKSVRVASDALEAMSPTPQDFAADKWWPRALP